MADEKKYTAREAAIAVLKKAEDMLKSSLAKDEKGDESMAGDKKAPSDSSKPEVAPHQPQAGESEKPGERVHEQTAPEDNPHEQKEGNNNEWGTEPATYGTLKLAHFLGRVHAKRSQKAKQVTNPDAQILIDPKNK